MQTFTVIKGVSERRRLPRLGKIRLGVKVLAKNGQTYPAEVDYFVVPPEVQQVYGPKPKTLDVMFPVQDRGVIFPQALKWYGSGRGLKCIGDGERAMRLNEASGAMEPMDCPCPLYEQGQCHRRAHLMVILPKINMGGVYQIDMGSYNSIVDLNSGLDYVEALVGRVAMVPLVLTRVARETFGSGQRRVHYPLQVTLATNDVGWINRLRTETATIMERQAALVLPAPADENPAHDDGAVVVPEAELAPEALPTVQQPTEAADQPSPASGGTGTAGATGTASVIGSAGAADPVSAPADHRRPTNGVPAATDVGHREGQAAAAQPASRSTAYQVMSVALPKTGKSGKQGPYTITLANETTSWTCKCWESDVPAPYKGARAMALIGKAVVCTTRAATNRMGEPEIWIERMSVEDNGTPTPASSTGQAGGMTGPTGGGTGTTGGGASPVGSAGPARSAGTASPRPSPPRNESPSYGPSPAQARLIRTLCAEREVPSDRVEAVLTAIRDPKEASVLLDAMLKRQDYSRFGPAMSDGAAKPDSTKPEMDLAEDEEVDGSYL